MKGEEKLLLSWNVLMCNWLCRLLTPVSQKYVTDGNRILCMPKSTFSCKLEVGGLVNNVYRRCVQRSGSECTSRPNTEDSFFCIFPATQFTRQQRNMLIHATARRELCTTGQTPLRGNTHERHVCSCPPATTMLLWPDEGFCSCPRVWTVGPTSFTLLDYHHVQFKEPHITDAGHGGQRIYKGSTKT